MGMEFPVKSMIRFKEAGMSRDNSDRESMLKWCLKRRRDKTKHMDK